MATNRFAGEGAVTASSATILTVGASLVATGTRLTVTNTSTTVARDLTVNVAQDGGVSATGNQFLLDEVITAKEERAFTLPQVLRAGAKVYIIADATGLNYTITGANIVQSVDATATV